MEIHHVKPRAKGGSDAFENAIPLCFDCHQDMGYDSTHPRGTKYSEEELIRRRDIFYNKIQSGFHGASHNTSRFTDHDKKLLRTLNDKFNMNYLYSLKNEPFWKLVKRSVVDPICDYIDYESEDPLNAFDNQELESLRNQIIEEGRAFNDEFSQHSGGSQSPQHYEYINKDYFNGMPKDICDDLKTSRNKVLKHAADLHQVLLRLRNFERII